jgi:hypothetical protein
MPDLGEALRAATAAVLTGGLAVAGAANAIADPNTGSPADMNTLAGSLSKGYDLNNCTAQNLTTGQPAALACGQNPDPAGPAQAKYILLNNGDSLAGSFKTSIRDDVLISYIRAPNNDVPALYQWWRANG